MHPISMPMSNFTLNSLVSLKCVVYKQQQEQHDAENPFLGPPFSGIKTFMISEGSVL
jgi:hypothetical protein